MTRPESLSCENCEQPIDRLGEAYVWLDRPVCKPCFKRLAATRSVRFRSFWMPAALGLFAVAITLGVMLATRASDSTTDQPLSRPSQGAAASPDNLPKVTPAVSDELRKEQVLDIFKADRTWYSHWEDKKKDRPVKWTVNGETIIAGSGTDKPGRLEKRWVLVMDGHMFVVMDDSTLTGFFVRTGRAKGYFTEQSLPKAPTQK